MDARLLRGAVVLLLLAGGCTTTLGNSDAVYTQEVSSKGPQLPSGASVESTIVGVGDAAALLARRPELSSAVLSQLPRYVGATSFPGSHLTVVTEILGGGETESGAELYLDGVFYWWALEGGELDFPSGGEFIGRMRFEESGGTLVFSAWDRPLDGELLIPGIRSLFPRPHSEDAISRLGPNRVEQWQLGEELGKRWAAQQRTE